MTGAVGPISGLYRDTRAAPAHIFHDGRVNSALPVRSRTLDSQYLDCPKFPAVGPHKARPVSLAGLALADVQTVHFEGCTFNSVGGDQYNRNTVVNAAVVGIHLFHRIGKGNNFPCYSLSK